MIEEQIEMNKRKKLMKEQMNREEELKELERIQRENEELERRKELEDQLEREKHRQLQSDNILISKKKIFKGNEEEEQEKFNKEKRYEATKEDLKNDVYDTMKEMQDQQARLREQLQNDLHREKAFLKDLPNEIQKKIASTMNLELQRMKNEVNYGTNILRDQILKLRSQAVEIDQERRKAADELQELRSRLAGIQYQDDIRTQELLEALAEDNLNRILPSSSKFEMPEALFRDDEQNRFPIDYYEKDRRVKGEEKLFTDGYFLAEDSLDRYFEQNGGNGKISQSMNFEPYRHDGEGIGRIYERNNDRDAFFSSVLREEQGGGEALDEFLERDLDVSNFSF